MGGKKTMKWAAINERHHAMPALDLESIHKAYLARIFKTKIEIFSSMIYKIF